MSAKEIAKFEHILSLFGVGSAFQQLCSHHSIITHRKMKGKMKDMHDLEYLDPTSNTLKKLSEEELDEVQAFLPFMNAMQNETGPIMLYPNDITKYSREDFVRYQEDSYDSDNPTQYNYAMSLIAEKHNKEMEKLATTTANVMTTTGGTTGTIEINHSTDNIGEPLFHVPTPCGFHIINTNPNSKGGANVVEENREDETPASNNGINCNNGLGIGTNGRGFDVDDDGILPHEPTSNPGDQIATTKTYPTDAAPGSTNGMNCSYDNNGESLSHGPPYEPPPIVNISPNTKGANINGENGEFGHSGTMEDYGECTQLNNNNDNNEYEHAERTQYRRLATEDITTCARSSAQLYSRSENNSHKERTRDEWEAIALCTHLTDRVSKYVKNAISSYAVKDWQWLAKLVERLTHRGLLWYGVIVVVIMGVVMHDAHVGIENYVVRSIRSFSLNNPFDSSDMHGLIPLSWGRSSDTRSTHFEYYSPEINPSSSSSPYQYGESHPVGHNRFIPPMRHISTQEVRWRYTCEHTASVELVLLSPNYDTLPSQDEMDSFASRVDLSGVICPPSQSHSNQLTSSSANSEYENVLFDTSTEASKTFEDEPRLWEDEDYANPLITWNAISPMDRADDMMSDINSFSLNNLAIDSSMLDIIPSERGGSSATYPTSHDIPSDATSTIRDTSEIFANMMRLWGAVYQLVLPQTIVMSSLPTSYSHAATGSDTTFGTSLPSHTGACIQTKLTENALRHTDTYKRHTNTSKTHSDMCRMDEQTLSSGLMTLVPNYYDDLTSQDVRFNLNLRVGNPTNTYQLTTKYIRTRSLVQNNTEANYGNDMPTDGECLNIPQDRMKHDICRDSVRYDSMQQIFEESGENMIWAWPINRLLGIIGLTSARDTLVDTDIVSDPDPDESEILDEEGIRIYQSLIGAKWLVQLDRFDIAVLIMTLSSYWHSLVVATLIGELIEQ